MVLRVSILSTITIKTRRLGLFFCRSHALYEWWTVGGPRGGGGGVLRSRQTRTYL